MNNRVRIKDIAEKAGVSPGTVDRVIHKRGNVSPDAKEKVAKVMEEMGYERNIIASTLAYNRVFDIACILPDYKMDVYWQQPKLGIEKATRTVQHYGLNVENYYFDLFDSHDFTLEAGKALLKRPDLIIFSPIFLQESLAILEECTKHNIPAIIINTYIEHPNMLCYIGQDSYQSGVLAAKLLSLSIHKDTTLMVLNLDKEIANAKHLLDKQQGFIDYFDTQPHLNVTIIQCNVEDFDNQAALATLMKQEFEKHPTLEGIFVTNSRAYKAASVLTDEMVEQVKLVGFDLIKPNINLLENDKIRFLINQNAMLQGYQAIINAVNYLILKKDIEHLIYLPLDVVVSENIQYYLEKETESRVLI